MTIATFRKITHTTLFVAIIVTAFISITGCSFLRHSMAAARSTDHFIESPDDPRVLFEPGAEPFAKKISVFLPDAIQQIEEKQYQPFPRTVQVYICASRKSFMRMYGADVRAGVLTKLFLSPRVFEEDDEIIRMYLLHELSHLHILEQIGNYRMGRLPFWFKEGLATYVSGGGGAHTVTEDEAMRYFMAGKHFVPNETGGLLFRNTPSDWGLKPHM